MPLGQYLIDVTPSKSKHQMSKISKKSPLIAYSFLVSLLVPLGPLILVLLGPLIFNSAETFNFSSTGTFNFNSTGTFMHLNTIRTVPDRCYPFKVQTSNEQNLQDIPFYTLLNFSSVFISAGNFNFSSAGTFLHLNA